MSLLLSNCCWCLFCFIVVVIHVDVVDSISDYLLCWCLHCLITVVVHVTVRYRCCY